MKVCRQCGKTAENDGNFCPHCGGVMENAAFCPHCGAAMPESETVCPVCGKNKNEEARSENEVSSPAVGTPADGAETGGAGKEKKKTKKTGLFIGIGAAVIVIAAATAFVIRTAPFGTAERMELMYESDGDLYFLRSDKGESVRAAKNADFSAGYLIQDGKTVLYQNEETVYTLSLIDKNSKPKKTAKTYGPVQFSEKGIVAYVDTDDELFFGMYDKPESVDTDVSDFTYDAVSGSLAYITYDGDLYLMPKGHEAERATKHGTGTYFVSKNGNGILFLDANGDVSLKKYGKDRETLASDVYELVFASDDLSEFYFLDEDRELCVQKGKKSEKVIFDDPCAVVRANGNGILFLSEHKDSNDLYFYDGKDYEEIEEDVEYAYSYGTVDGTTFCSYSVNERSLYLIERNGVIATFDELTGEEADSYDYLFTKDGFYIAGEEGIYFVSDSAKLSEKAKTVETYSQNRDRHRLLSEYKGKPVYAQYNLNDDYDYEDFALIWNGTELSKDGADLAAVGDLLYYLTEGGELYRFDGKESALVLENVHDMSGIGGKIYCVADYDEENESGELYVIRSKQKPKSVAENATWTYSVWSADKKGTNYLW